MADNNEKSMGPLGLGDPYDESLTDLERSVQLPQFFLQTAAQYCEEEAIKRDRCMVKYGIAGLIKCRPLRLELTKCVQKWAHDPRLIQECTDLFLRRRKQYRLTGEITKDEDKKVKVNIGERKELVNNRNLM